MCNEESKIYKDIEEQIAKIVKETINQRGKEILMLSNIKDLYFHLSSSVFLDASNNKRIKQVVEEKTGDSQELFDSVFRSVIVKLSGQSFIPFMMSEVDREYQSFMLEMITGAYESAKRTLRWILETTIWSYAFQALRSGSLSELVDETIEEQRSHSNINLCREKEQEITSNVYVVLLQFKEMFQFRPPISKIVDKISFLEKERIKKELNKLYGNLSKHVHFTPESTIMIKPSDIKQPFSPLFGKFDQNLFDDTFNLAVDVFDVLFALLLCTNASYFNYPSVKEYIQDYDQKEALLKLTKSCNFDLTRKVIKINI
ncbi:MAG: hypothetical protein ACPLSP_04635 [Fervidicoccus fontis]